MRSTAADLGTAVERLYSLFAGYPLDSPDPCWTCYAESEVRRIGQRLRTTPLRLLTLDDLSHFYSDGILTWGGVDDFRHLLPRLMELFAAYHLGATVEWHGRRLELRMELDPHLALLRFVDAKWWTWPEVERVAVNGFFRAFWDAYLADAGNALAVGEWIDADVPEAILRLVSLSLARISTIGEPPAGRACAI